MYDFYCRYVKGAAFKIFLLSVLGIGSSACGVYMALVSKNVVDVATGQVLGSFLLEGARLLVFLLLQLTFQIGISMLHVRTSAGLKKDIQHKLLD